ncbi:hypothetical protein [Nonomuraea sp. NPDC049784]|uniref:hypothetical protein n=1 Tax=Nonomuraea sp. NPDC049784 TaxID=3154361 RepID=UPI0033E2C305
MKWPANCWSGGKMLCLLRPVLDMEAADGHPKWLHDLHASLSRRTTEIRSRLLGA